MKGMTVQRAIHSNAHSDLILFNTKKEDGSEEEARASAMDAHNSQAIIIARDILPNQLSHPAQTCSYRIKMSLLNAQSTDYSSSMVPPPKSMEVECNLPQCPDKSIAWVNQPQGFVSQAGPQSQQVSDQSLAERHAVSSLQPPMPPNYQIPVNLNQAMLPPAAFSYSFPVDGSQQYYSIPYENFCPEQLQAGGLAQGSVLGFSPASAGIATFACNAQRPWVAVQMVVLLDPSLMLAQGSLQGHMNVTDAQGNNQISGGWLRNQRQIGQDTKLQGVSAVNNDISKGVFAQLQ